MCSMGTLLKLYVRPRADGAQSFVPNIRNEGLVAFFLFIFLLTFYYVYSPHRPHVARVFSALSKTDLWFEFRWNVNFRSPIQNRCRVGCIYGVGTTPASSESQLAESAPWQATKRLVVVFVLFC